MVLMAWGGPGYYPPPPKYYYEVTKYAIPFAPPSKERNPKLLFLVCFLLYLLAGINLITGFALIFLSQEEQGVEEVLLKGTVFDGNTFTPLSDVKITIPSMGLSTSSDDDGKFSLSLPAGEHNIFFEKNGYATVNGTVVVGKYLDNNINVEMEKGKNITKKQLTYFGTFEEYIANMLASATLTLFLGGFGAVSGYQIRKGMYRSLGIVSGVLGIFSVVFLWGLTFTIFWVSIVSLILGILILFLLYRCSDLFLAQPKTTAGTDLL